MDFGDATGFGRISGEYFSLSAGVDTAPLFKGLDGDLCQCPHWGFVLRGQITTTDAGGVQETVHANDLSTGRLGERRLRSTRSSPGSRSEREHSVVISHMINKAKG